MKEEMNETLTRKPKRKLFYVLLVLVIVVVIVGIKLFLFQSDEKIFYEKSNDRLESITTNLLVDDVNSAAAFYKKYFGFKLYKLFPEEGRATLAVMELRKLYVMFQDRKNFEEEKPMYIGGTIEPSFSLYIDYKGAKELYNRLKDSLEIVQEYQLMFYGRYEFSVKDLNGYIITFSDDIQN